MSTVEIVVTAFVTIVIFVAGEFLIPVDPNAPNAAHASHQRHFWSTLLAALAFVMSLQFGFIFKTRDEIADLTAAVRNINGIYAQVIDQGVTDDISKIIASTGRILKNDPRNQLKNWMKQDISRLREDMNNDYVPISSAISRQAIAETLEAQEAQLDDRPLKAFATNVGGTRFYFQSWYELMNKKAVDTNHMPIVRFFLYSADHEIELGDQPPSKPTKEQFAAEVKRIHEQFKALYTAVVDVGECGIHPRDLLLVNETLLESVLDDDWSVEGLRATRSGEPISKALEFLQQVHLCAEKQKVEFLMDSIEVHRLFQRQVRAFLGDTNSASSDDRLAARLATAMLSQ
jgi:hypothetical protein